MKPWPPKQCPFCGEIQTVLWECQIECKNGETGIKHIDWINAWWVKKVSELEKQNSQLLERFACEIDPLLIDCRDYFQDMLQYFDAENDGSYIRAKNIRDRISKQLGWKKGFKRTIYKKWLP